MTQVVSWWNPSQAASCCCLSAGLGFIQQLWGSSRLKVQRTTPDGKYTFPRFRNVTRDSFVASSYQGHLLLHQVTFCALWLDAAVSLMNYSFNLIREEIGLLLLLQVPFWMSPAFSLEEIDSGNCTTIQLRPLADLCQKPSRNWVSSIKLNSTAILFLPSTFLHIF